jgi:F0F1-type ATP synthase epsilon subunit
VHVRLADGAGITIYPGHAPLLAETLPGSLRYADATGEREIDVQAGILQVGGDLVTIFTSGSWESTDQPAPTADAEERSFERLAGELQARLAGESRAILERERETG